MTTDTAKLRELLAKGTQGEWHHVQAFQSVPAQKTIHGTVPGQRVDYVSTWPGPGTPKGHRVIVPMETLTDSGVARTVSSNDMALIVAAVNALPALCVAADERDALREERDRMREDADLVGALRDNSWDLRCFDIPTGGGDADIGWRVIGHYMAAPNERVIAEVHTDDPKAAILKAIARAALGETK